MIIFDRLGAANRLAEHLCSSLSVFRVCWSAGSHLCGFAGLRFCGFAGLRLLRFGGVLRVCKICRICTFAVFRTCMVAGFCRIAFFRVCKLVGYVAGMQRTLRVCDERCGYASYRVRSFAAAPAPGVLSRSCGALTVTCETGVVSPKRTVTKRAWGRGRALSMCMRSQASVLVCPRGCATKFATAGDRGLTR